MTYQSRVSESDLFGLFFIAVPKEVSFFPTGYYTTLEALYPLLQDEHFKQCQTAYYINGINKEVVRLSYFTQPGAKDKLVDAVRDFVKKNNLEHVTSGEEAKPAIVAQNYGGQQLELRFRNYLSLETRIGIEILKFNPRHVKSLMLTYRLQVFPTNSPIEPHLEPTFLKDSETYCSLNPEQKQQFWADLAFSPGTTDWDHFLVNLILGIDFTPSYLRSLRDPLAISEINKISSREIGFTIDPNWQPTG